MTQSEPPANGAAPAGRAGGAPRRDDPLHVFASLAPIVIFSLDTAGRFTLSEGAGLKVLGRCPGQVVGQSIYEVHAGSSGVIQAMERALAGETVKRAVTINDRVFDATYVPIRGEDGAIVGVTGLALDVTEQRAAQHRLQAYFELSLDLLCVLSTDGFFTEVNPAFERVLGHPREEILRTPFTEFIHPDDREATRAQYEKLEADGHAYQFENRYRCRDGSYRWLQWSASVDEEVQRVYAIGRDVTEQRAVGEQLEHAALTDALTGLPNRRAIETRLDQEVSRATREETALSLAIVDADRFKRINDRFGHAAGDAALRALAAALRDELREHDLIGRWGGDEFLVLLPATSPKAAADAIDRTRRTIAATGVPLPGGEAIGLCVSAGVQTWDPTHHAAPADLVRDADLALLEAKARGRDRVVAFSDLTKAARGRRVA